MTVWDFLSKLFSTGGLTCIILVAAIIGFIWMIAHPIVVREWNVQISTWIAEIAPKKRKSAYEKRLDLTIDSAKTKFSESAPKFMQRFLPYSLKVKWVNENETMETFQNDNQIIMYVPSFKSEAQQTVGILHNYCSAGFAQKAKIYMTTDTVKASDLIVTEKLVQFAGHGVYDYYCREYLPEMIRKDISYALMFDKLKRVDTDGLFLPILLNEIDKYSSRIYPSAPTSETKDVILHLINFIYKIISRKQGEEVDLSFCEGDVRIHIVLAVSDSTTNTHRIVRSVEKKIINKCYDTIYVLATGSKIDYAKQITQGIRNRNVQEISSIIETCYKRYTRKASGADSICYEININ